MRLIPFLPLFIAPGRQEPRDGTLYPYPKMDTSYPPQDTFSPSAAELIPLRSEGKFSSEISLPPMGVRFPWSPPFGIPNERRHLALLSRLLTSPLFFFPTGGHFTTSQALSTYRFAPSLWAAPSLDGIKLQCRHSFLL